MRDRTPEREMGVRERDFLSLVVWYIYIYWVLTKKVAKKIRLYVAQEI